jgi:hypothetical protein
MFPICILLPPAFVVTTPLELIFYLLPGFLAIVISQYFWVRFFSRRGIPDSISWVGPDQGYFTRAYTTICSFWDTKKLVQEGYNKVTKFPLLACNN